MLHTSIKLYLVEYAKRIISASCCITNVFLEIKKYIEETNTYTLTHASYLGTGELKRERVGKYHGVRNRDWDAEFHI